jgi:3-keto-disaccharide hydrolase
VRLLWCGAAVAMICAAGILWSAAGTGHTAEQSAGKDGPPPALPEAVLKQTQPIFDGKSLDGWVQVPADSWTARDGAMASTGAGRGVIYTKDDYTKYRLVFTMRHVSGNPDHQAAS